jgi:hypothetical protein
METPEDGQTSFSADDLTQAGSVPPDDAALAEPSAPRSALPGRPRRVSSTERKQREAKAREELIYRI